MKDNEMLDSLPEFDKAAVQYFLLMQGQNKSLVERMNPEHVTQALENERLAELHNYQKTELEHKEITRKHLLLFILTIVALMVLVTLLMVVLFVYKESPEFVEKLIYTIGGAIIGALGGGAAGFSYGKSKRNE